MLANSPTVNTEAPAASPALGAELPADDFSRLRAPPSSGTATAADGVVAANADARTLPDGVPGWKNVTKIERRKRVTRTGAIITAADNERPSGRGTGQLRKIVHAVVRARKLQLCEGSGTGAAASSFENTALAGIDGRQVHLAAAA